jgi:hypothetical protein
MMKDRSPWGLAGALGALSAMGCGASSPLLGGEVDAGASPQMDYRVEAISARCDDLRDGAIVPGVVGDDTTSAVLPLPEPFVFFGVARTAYSVSSNGFLQLYASQAGAMPMPGVVPTAPAPSDQLPRGLVAPLYDDLELLAGAEVRQRAVDGADPYRVFEWRAAGFCCGAVDRATLTFQAKLFRSGRIEFHYCQLDASPAQRDRAAGSNALVGLQDSTATRGVTVTFQRSGPVSMTTGYRFTPLR